MDFSVDSDILGLLQNMDGLEDFTFEMLNEVLAKSDTVTLKRRVPWIESLSTPPTDVLPSLAGVHSSERNAIGKTFRFPDGKCYAMVTKIN